MTSPAMALLTAFALSLVATPLCRAAARRFGLLDRPNERSSHQRVVPRGGGTAIALSVLVALWLARPFWADRPGALAILLGGVALALIGLADDRAGLSAFTRLVAQLGVVGLVVLRVGGFERVPLPALLGHHLGPLGTAATVLWIVAVVNFYNFLDGIDGLAALQAVVTGAGVLLAGFDPFAALLAAALVGAAAGFLPFNWSPASIFLGDIGSYFLGYTLAALPLLAPPQLRSQAAVLVAREPVAVPRRRHVDARRTRPSWRAPLRSASGAPLPEAGPALGPREGHGGDRLGLLRPDRGGGPLVAQPDAAVGVGGVRPRPRSLRNRVDDGAIRRTSRGDDLALARAPVVRGWAPPRPHPGPGRPAHLGVLLRGPRPALRRPDPARERGDLPALPAALPRDPAVPAPRVRPAPLVLPALGLLRGHAGGDGDGGRHRRLRGRLLLPPDPRPATLGAGDGVLPDGEPRAAPSASRRASRTTGCWPRPARARRRACAR